MVPGEVTGRLVQRRLSQPDVREKGFVLDGFPRNFDDARIFQSMPEASEIDGVLQLEVPEEERWRRVKARARPGETREVFENRMRVYAQETLPVIALLKERYDFVTAYPRCSRRSRYIASGEETPRSDKPSRITLRTPPQSASLADESFGLAGSTTRHCS